ncbi:DUF2919 family protein [Candidatus Halobeggiatoa sp. HSG11]|nr:DUF2919 family protein [Candidatus Halobeggiatoa sp. HSG11]
MPKYSFEDYNEHNVLKIPSLLILLNLYLLKYIIIFILPMISKISAIKAFAHDHFTVILLLPAIPAFLVLVSMILRVPESRYLKIVKQIWGMGRWLLLSSAILEIIIISVYLLLDIKQFGQTLLIFLYLDFMAIIFLLKSQRLRDVFAEFPTKEINS